MTRIVTETKLSLWKQIVQKWGLWREKVENRGKIPEIRGFCPQNLWKTPWIMWMKPVEKVEIPVDGVLYIHFKVYIEMGGEL